MSLPAFRRGLSALLVVTMLAPTGAAAGEPGGGLESSSQRAVEEPARGSTTPEARLAARSDAPQTFDAVSAPVGIDPASHRRGEMLPRRPAFAIEAGFASAADGTSPTKDATSSSAIPLPTAEASVTGMGESFAAALSVGAASFNIPLRVPPGRNGVQPSLDLEYSSTSGNGHLGLGWNIAVPFIGRQSDRGLPRYLDQSAWHPQEDRFFYNGGQELVPVDSAQVELADCGKPGCAPLPVELNGWQQYRARVEGEFMRFFRAPDSRRWIVHTKDGSRLDFGLVNAGPAEMVGNHNGLDSEFPDGQGRVHRWRLVRSSDPHGSTVYFVHGAKGTERYLTDVYYLSPHSACGALPSPSVRMACDAPLSSYGRRIKFVYESRADQTSTFASTWQVDTTLRLRRVEMTSANSAIGSRSLVRRYHFRYDSTSFWSLLNSVQLEGRPVQVDLKSGAVVGNPEFAEEALADAIVGQVLPPSRFEYTQQPMELGGAAFAAGFGGVSRHVNSALASPNRSVGTNADLFDVNSDGLPDLVATEPGQFPMPNGAPGVGVYFNGFLGGSTDPGIAGSFSPAVSTALPSEMSAALRLSNLNVHPMDVDGDGRSDYLHLPRSASNGYFTPIATGDPTEFLPAQQEWTWAYVRRHLPDYDADPRIDFAHDGGRIKVFDVNNDHLVDIVRTNGSAIQVWLNLGWLPGGDGRYGSASYHAGSWHLSTTPIESCLVRTSLPLDFADPEVSLADMNGDGLTDIVKMRKGNLIYWPGRGEGAFGVGSSTCDAGNSASRHVIVASPPVEIAINGDGVHLVDVNADGLADVLQVRATAVDVWFNRGGRAFSTRVTINGTPFAPSFDPKVRVTDLDGSGTIDVVYARAGNWQWIDLMGGQRPRLLRLVQNSLGGETTLAYAPSSEDYLRDLAEASACSGSSCERFVWGADSSGCDLKVEFGAGICGRRPTSSPVVSSVVRRVEVSDRLDRLNHPQSVEITKFHYHDAYYEGIEQEFRGFAVVDAVSIGDVDEPTLTQRTRFHQGRRDQAISSDPVADNPEEALKGTTALIETFDEAGVYGASEHASYEIRCVVKGLSGVCVDHAVAIQADTFVYDTSSFEGTPDAYLSLPGVQRSDGSSRPDKVRVRAAGYAHLRSSVDEVDGVGNHLQSTRHGRIRGELGEPVADERIIGHAKYVNLLNGITGWQWRQAGTHVTGANVSERLSETESTYTESADLLLLKTIVQQSVLPVFAGDQGSEDFGARAPENMVASAVVDNWGSVDIACAGGDAASTVGCLRLSTIERDVEYALTPVRQRIMTRRAAGGFESLVTTAAWDRGLTVPTSVLDVNGEKLEVKFDGLGRTTLMVGPDARGCTGRPPSVRITHLDPEDPEHKPMAVVLKSVFTSCASFAARLDSYTYFDGLARIRAKLGTGSGAAGEKWLKGGNVTYNRKGAIKQVYQADFWNGDPADYRAVLIPPSIPPVRGRYDAFGRNIANIAEDGSESRTVYHSLSSDSWDALDLGLDPAHSAEAHFLATPVTTRVDGHGRVIDTILRNRQPGSSAVEYHRLFTTYRADGVAIQIDRAQTQNELPRPLTAFVGGRLVTRTFVYDSVGRRITGIDPDTTDPITGASWRYLYNRVGDLVARRDARGCGQNYYYDHAGRGIGESYVSCDEAQRHEGPVAILPVGAIGWEETSSSTPVDAANWFDSYPGTWMVEPGGLSDFPSDAGGVSGRLTAVADRGQRTIFAYDRRGNPIWEGRQMAIIPADKAIAASIPPTGGVVADDAFGDEGVTYDTTRTYVRSLILDHADRIVAGVLPSDPDAASMPSSFRLAASIQFDAQGLPKKSLLHFVTGVGEPIVADGTLGFVGNVSVSSQPITANIDYTRDGLPREIVYGDSANGTRTPTRTSVEYDVRRRPRRMLTVRQPTSPDVDGSRPLSATSVLHGVELGWDMVSNLVHIEDLRIADEWPAGHRPQSSTLTHDALYRVAGVAYTYAGDGQQPLPADSSSDWRTEQMRVRSSDPMRQRPAPMLPDLPEERVNDLAWQFDWLSNMTFWSDDAHAFFERSVGQITNGADLSPAQRPAALYLASDLAGPPEARGGWAELEYGSNGNVVAMTVHAECVAQPAKACADPGGSLAARKTAMAASCLCQAEQKYHYRWDELNRLAEARRYERAGTGPWFLQVRQRYRYSAGNTRVLKQTIDVNPDPNVPAQRVALYIFNGDFERRGLVRTAAGYQSDSTLDTQSEYLVAGARVVWQSGNPEQGIDPDHRISVPISDLIGSTAAVLDIRTGELTQHGTYYPNGARETLRGGDDLVPFDPLGFTGKEDDQEVGLVYFGERYLIAGIGRWASPDPAAIDAMEGGEPLNSYHYVSGNLLQARDPLGLDPHTDEDQAKYVAYEQAKGIAAARRMFDAYDTAARGDAMVLAQGNLRHWFGLGRGNKPGGPGMYEHPDVQWVAEQDRFEVVGTPEGLFSSYAIDAYNAELDRLAKNAESQGLVLAITWAAYDAAMTFAEFSVAQRRIPRIPRASQVTHASAPKADVAPPGGAGTPPLGGGGGGANRSMGDGGGDGGGDDRNWGRTPSTFTNNAKLATQDEIDAAKALADMGEGPVILRDPENVQAKRTSDVLWNGETADIYTPEPGTPAKRIVGSLLGKNSQATILVLNLSKSDVSLQDLGNVWVRLKGAFDKRPNAGTDGKTFNIKKVVIIK